MPLSSPLTVAGPCRIRTDFPGLQREALPTLAAADDAAAATPSIAQPRGVVKR